MKNFDNDNELFSFISLAAATANVVRYLEQDRNQRPDGDDDKYPGNEVSREREQQRFVETRLREIERFEARYRRNRPWR